MTRTYHDPVLLQESVDALNINPEGTYVDVTFGGGGHSSEILRRLGKKGRLIAFDRDADTSQNQVKDERLIIVRHNYRFLRNFLRYHNAIPVDGILADLGISSYQIDEATRGFSLRFDAPLDMRMNREMEMTAADVLAQYPEEELVRIFSAYGEVFNSKTLARKIVATREENPIRTTGELKTLLLSFADRQHEHQYYAKVFQALRIEVNDELESLKDMLSSSVEVLAEGGRLAVISYHSLEDRLVKNIIAKGSFEGEPEKDLFGNVKGLPFRAVTKKPIEPGEEEIERNPRARSAKLRIAEKRSHVSQ
jgi:16S rRNA (cytosine1402-N4)-methyltransferase